MIPRLLFGLAFAVSLLLILLVILAPLGDNGEAQPAGWAHVLALFARDPALPRPGPARLPEARGVRAPARGDGRADRLGLRVAGGRRRPDAARAVQGQAPGRHGGRR